MRLCLLLLALFTHPLIAWADTCAAETPGCAEIGSWQVSIGLGLGVRTNPVMDNDDIPLIVLPEISYTGQRFFLQNLDFGFVLWETPAQQLNLLATPSYDQVFFHRWSPGNFILESRAMPLLAGPVDDFNGRAEANFESSRIEVDMSRLHKRRMAALAGLEYSYAQGDWNLQVQWLADVSGVHDGQERRVALARQFHHGRHGVTFSVGANWQNAAVIDYYYGIRPGEVLFADHAYLPGGGTSAIARVDWRYALNERWSLAFTGIHRQLAKEITRSPLVTDSQVTTLFFGGVYHF